MYTKGKLLGRAQLAQVAALNAGYTADLRLYDDRLRLSLCDENFVCLAEICLSYGVDEVLGLAVLDTIYERLVQLADAAEAASKEEGGAQ